MLPSWANISGPAPAANTNDQQHNPNLNPNQFKPLMDAMKPSPASAAPVEAAAPAGEAAGAAAAGGEAAAGASLAELAPLALL